MTRKMFQVSRVLMVLITFGVILSLLLDQRVMILNTHIYQRCLLQLFALVIFLLASYLYEKKRKVFSTGYLFLMINVFINGTVCPCYYTNNRLLAMEREGYDMPIDYFPIYMAVYFILMTIVLIYLLMVRHTTEEIKQYEFFDMDERQDIAVLLATVLIALPLMLHVGLSGVMLVAPALCYFFCRILYTRFSLSQSVICAVGLLIGMYGLYRVRDQRYLVIEYIMPIIIIFFVFVAVNDNHKKGKKVVPLMILGIVAVLLYGMVSEIVKLNRYWGRNYSFATEFSNLKSYADFAGSQVYRLFGIWTILGGNIIGHTKLHGYYYGITYVKALAPYLGFEYVSLPQISARYIWASYAQPGLLAEGYANFGIPGAVLNLLVPFVLAELALSYFLKKRTAFGLCLLSLPFVKVLMDGGTINSIIAGVGVCVISFSLYLLLQWAGVRIHSVENIRLRLFKKPQIRSKEESTHE